MKKKPKRTTSMTLAQGLARKHTLRKGEKTAGQLKALADDAIDYSDIPALSEEFWKNARILKPSSKQMMTLRLDTEVIDWFKKMGKGYQSHMNTILRAYVETQRP